MIVSPPLSWLAAVSKWCAALIPWYLKCVKLTCEKDLSTALFTSTADMVLQTLTFIIRLLLSSAFLCFPLGIPLVFLLTSAKEILLGLSLAFSFFCWWRWKAKHWAVRSNAELRCGCFAVDDGNKSASACAWLCETLLSDFATFEDCDTNCYKYNHTFQNNNEDITRI